MPRSTPSVAALAALTLLLTSLRAQRLFDDRRHECFVQEAGGITSLAAGDFDRDGDLDLVRGCSAGPGQPAAPAAILWNQGQGNFGPASVLPVPMPLAVTQVLAGDFDRDGDLDLLVGCSQADRLRQLQNDGRGRFTDVTSTTLPNLSGSVLALQHADLDRDGDLDVVVAGHSTAFSLQNDGTGRFASFPSQLRSLGAVSTPPSMAVSIADFDGDRAPDVVISERFSGPMFHRNDGKGLLDYVKSMPLAKTAGTCLVHDFDGDGDPDVFVWPAHAPPSLFENRGGFQFSDVTARSLPSGLPCCHRNCKPES